MSEMLQEKGLVTKGRIRDAIANIFDVSSGQVSRLECIFSNLSIDFQQEFKAEKIGIAAAFDLSFMEPADQDVLFASYKANGIDVIKDALGKNSIAETDIFPVPVSIQDDAFKELTQQLAKSVNVQKQNRQTASGTESPDPLKKPSPNKPLIGSDTQYQSLLNLGIEAKLNQSYAKEAVDRAKYTERLEAFAMVADEFGFGRKAYLDDLNAILQDAKKNEGQ
jgi:hypothetical protein